LNEPEENNIYNDMFKLSEGPEKVLAYVYRPYLIDFKKWNNIYLVYQPFIVLPFNKTDLRYGTNAYIDYLNSNGIRYIATSIPPESDIEGLSQGIEGIKNSTSSFYNFHQQVIYNEALFRKFLLELRDSHKIIYHNGPHFLIDIKFKKE
jgi:hypothetical protein